MNDAARMAVLQKLKEAMNEIEKEKLSAMASPQDAEEADEDPAEEASETPSEEEQEMMAADDAGQYDDASDGPPKDEEDAKKLLALANLKKK